MRLECAKCVHFQVLFPGASGRGACLLLRKIIHSTNQDECLQFEARSPFSFWELLTAYEASERDLIAAEQNSDDAGYLRIKGIRADLKRLLWIAAGEPPP